jgi:putative flippase GtrA
VDGGELGLRVRPAGRPHRGVSKYTLPNRETLWRFVRFLVVGGGSLVVQLLVVWLLRPHVAENVAFSLSWVVSTATHYFANRYWALPSTRHDAGKQFGEYLFTVAVSYVINFVAFLGIRDGLGLGVFWATALAVPPSTVVVFLLLNYRVFRAKRKEGEAA